MKKLLIWLLGVILVLSMSFIGFGCRDKAAEEEVVAEKAYKFTFITHDAGTPFFAPTIVGMNDAAEAFGVEVEFIGPKTYDVAAQVDMIESAIQGGIDGLATTLPDTDAYDGMVQKALDMGIPVIGYNTDDDTSPNARMAFVGQDMVKAGMAMGEEIKKSLPDGGKVILCTCCPGHSALEARLKGTRMALDGSNVTVVEPVLVYGTDLTEAVSKIEASHLANPDISGFYSVDAYTEAIGRYISINDLHDKLLGGGFDLVPATLDYIKEDALQFTIGQNPYSQGFFPIVLLWLYLEKGIYPVTVDTGAEIIDKSNIDAIIEREALAE
jgi:ABC-type sugar transport system substrate-binding protein